jgi:ABC-type amino acid transport substrate-binding protein
MSVFGRLSWIFLFPIIAQADEPLRVGLIEGGRAPYFFAKDDHQTGLYKDIILAISRISHIDFMFDYYPQARLRKMMISGRLDVEVGTDPLWRQEPREAKISIYSKPFMTSQESWVVSRDNKDLIERFISNDITAKACVVLGFNIEDNMKNANSDLTTGDSDHQLLEMVAKKRCDIALIPNVILVYFNVFQDARFALLPAPKKYLLSIRLQAKYHHQLARINEALTQMKNNGELEQLLNKYGIQSHD